MAKRKRRSPNPQISIHMGKNAWLDLLDAAHAGPLNTSARFAASTVESRLSLRGWQLRGSRMIPDANALKRDPNNMIGQIQEYITQLDDACGVIENGDDPEVISGLLKAISDALRQDARVEQPRADTTFRISVHVERVVEKGEGSGITEETSKTVASFPTLDQASAYAALLHGLGAVLAFNDSDQLLRYGWRV